MKYLFLKLFRDVRTAKGQYIAITLVILLGVAFYCGVMSASSGVGANMDDFYENQKLADFWVKVPNAEDEVLEQIRELLNIEAADKRATFTGISGEREFIIHTLTENPGVNIPFIESGRFPENSGECIVDRGYAAVHDIKIGDILHIKIYDMEYIFSVSGIFNSPEYLYLTKTFTETPNHETYGALFLSEDFINIYSEIIIKAKNGADLAALKTEIAKAAVTDGLGVILTREQLLSWVMLDDDITQFGQLGAIFPVIFFIVAATIIFISMSKNVETQRNQIGNMKALGVRNRTITFHFMSYTLFTCTVGSILGVVIGIFVLMPLVQMVFTMLYTMPELHPAGYIGNVITAVALAFAFGIAATFFSVRKPLRESPASAMRPKPPRKIKPLILEHNERLWSKLSYSRKIVLRNLFLNKSRALLSSVGIIGCVGLMLAALSFMDCVNDMLNVKFYEMNKYNVNIALQSPTTDAEFPFDIEKWGKGNIHGVWACGSVPATFEFEDKAISTDLIALDSDCDAIALYDAKNKRLAFPTDGVLIPKLYADKYNLSVGDTLKLTLSPIAGEARVVTVKVSGVAAMHLGQDIYTSFEYLNEIGEIMPVSSFYLQMSKTKGLINDLKDEPAVKLAMDIYDIANTWEQSIVIMRTMVYILIVASSVLALTVVYNISAINIFERRRDIATLKVLGYHRREVNRLVFNENLIITGFGSILGIGAGAGMLWLIIKYVASDEMMVPMVMSPLSVLLAVALGFLFTILANQLLRGKVKKIDMVESLKSVE